MNKLKKAWSDVNSSLWFVHALLVVAALGLAYGLVRLDAGMNRAWLQDYPLLFGPGPTGPAVCSRPSPGP